MTYHPKPIDTSRVSLSRELTDLMEVLAENVHDHWAQQRLKEGWRYGPERNDVLREHPNLVAYKNLPESEKAYDRAVAMENLKATMTLGYRIEKRK